MRIYSYKELDSTMDIAHELAKKGEEEGTIVLADVQRKGRGRKGNYWESPEGGLWFSVIFYPKLRKEEIKFLPIVFCVSVIQGLELFLTKRINVKWPNDIELDGKKVGGILLESSWNGDKLEYVICGVGINLFVPLDFFKDRNLNATSLLPYLIEKDKFLILKAIWEKMLLNYENYPYNWDLIYQYYLEKFPYVGKIALIRQEADSKFVKILKVSREGALIVEEEGEIKKYEWGEISVRH
ncbi:MAG: biotin--[acetyl-CoA-carboxylase] ligase [Dictyoglomus sp. NZ13-RE01]|nr:MAG: biotin--[acetyl-CoA-carboxylase] ligase [Dictyoglomus sp. NZ13-RE01]